jgi:RNAse (barnase) inhibitor barstar
MNYFCFFKDGLELASENNAINILVSKNIKDKKDLFNLFSTKLKFPSYFGNNWDALYDCLMDLNWIHENKISIIHEDIPFYNIEEESKKYLELMSDVILKWHDNENKFLNIYFPDQYRKEIHEILCQ